MLAGIGAAYGILYSLIPSDPAVVTVNDVSQQIKPTITPSSTTITTGQTVTLTAQATVNWANKPISFYDGTTLLQTVNTDATGVASITITPQIGVHSYTAGP